MSNPLRLRVFKKNYPQLAFGRARKPFDGFTRDIELDIDIKILAICVSNMDGRTKTSKYRMRLLAALLQYPSCMLSLRLHSHFTVMNTSGLLIRTCV